ncbi:MAG TPA: ATP-binding protein [Candidatus Melainabacteria bacterium]|nr:ATP-binding protein [Candidatus Melainabacteria bacterium]
MRLKSIYIGQYKNLKDFTLSFDGTSFIDVFVGKNGTGKSNFFEVLLEIFQHLYEYGKGVEEPNFEYGIRFEIEGKETEVTWDCTKLRVNGRERKTIGRTPLPDNVLIYYSGHNDTVRRLVDKYEDAFRKRIKKASFDESRSFIGIGHEYKELLLSLLLMQKVDNKARKFVSRKLGIKAVSREVKLILQRPSYAGSSAFDIEDTEVDRYWKPEGVTKTFLDRLSKCISEGEGSAVRSEGYFSSEDRYILYFDIEKIQMEFRDFKSQELFRQFDNLKTLGMLQEISIALTLDDDSTATIAHFSDGQFQSIYMYSIIELFKDRNCITLLDEPDSFLHPEWQYDFLSQVFEITDTAGKNNHVLMSSHSAVTLIPHDRKKIKFFDIKDNKTNCYDLPKSIAIKKLSADLIRYSEQEQLLSIINAIQIENKPVLFTEGTVDPIILKEAWIKLFEEQEMPFIPFYAFSCSYIKQLLTDSRIHTEMRGLPVFALFDFDRAYDQWNGLTGDVIESDPQRGLIKKWTGGSGESYAIMLPVPSHADIQRQVVKNAATKETFGGDSCCEIEHLFYGHSSTSAYYREEPWVGGKKIVFKSDEEKTSFAKDVIPLLNSACFEVFRPMFEFIQSKCSVSS